MSTENRIEGTLYFARALLAARQRGAPLSEIRAIYADLEENIICLGYAFEDEENGNTDHRHAAG